MVVKHVYISGKVQGVSFRYYSFERAQKLGITGWIRNLEDGRVEVVACARDGKTMDEFVSFLKVGPPRATIEGFEIVDVAGGDIHFEEFSIRRDGGPTW